MGIGARTFRGTGEVGNSDLSLVISVDYGRLVLILLDVAPFDL